MKQFLLALVTLFVFVPASVFVATILWNSVLTDIVSWANPITFWQMFGLMVLLWIVWPGQKPKITIKNDE
jgi:hypothetical protein